MSSKSKKRHPERVSMVKATVAAEVMFVWAWMECFHPSKEEVDKLSAEIRNIRESVATHRLNIWEVREAIKDEYGWEI